MKPLTLTDADHGGLIEPSEALLKHIALKQEQAKRAEMERQERGQQVLAVERRGNRGGR